MTCKPLSTEMASLRLYEDETSIAEIAARHGLELNAIIDFSLNVNPFGPPAAAVTAAERALAMAWSYPDLRFTRLRRALAERHDVDPDALFFGAGLDDVLKLMVQAWTSEGDRVLVHLPTFPRYEFEARLRGCEVLAAESAAPETVNVAGMRAMLRRHPVAMAFLCTPNNPTGATISNDDISALALEFAETIFVVDEALIYPLDDGAVPLVHEYQNLAVLRTFSKYYGLAGMRVGYAVADPNLVRIADTGRPPFNVAGPSAEAALGALSDTGFLECCKSIFAEELAWFSEALASIGHISVRSGSANMLLLDLGRHAPAEVVNALGARGVVVADGTSFRGLEDRNTIRVSLRGREENAVLLDALRAVL